MNDAKLIQMFLPDGTLEGVRILELSGSSVKAFVIPRLKLTTLRQRPELSQPALYFLINSETSRAYIGESENFLHRALNHSQNKEWWDLAVAMISTTNTLEKSDVKYLESMAVERSSGGSMDMENKTIPARNNIHEFKLHILDQVLSDTQFILTSLGYDVLSQPEKNEQIWYCRSKNTDARAVFRGDKFVVLSGSKVDKLVAPSWAKSWPKALLERKELLAKFGKEQSGYVELAENVPFKSPNHAGGFLTGRNVNAWTTFRDESGKTMDEVMRKEK